MTGALQAEPGEELMRRFAKCRTKEPMEVKLRETGFLCSLGEEDVGLILRCKEIAASAETAEGVVMKQNGHSEDDTTQLDCFWDSIREAG